MKYLSVIIASILIISGLGCGPGPDGPDEPDDPGYQDIPAIITELPGLSDSLVICPDCPPGLLTAKTAGILAAMADLVEYAGADVNWEYAPATFHLQGGQVCGEYAVGTTGFWKTDAQDRAQICLFDLEKAGRSLPFTPENAAKPEDQLLPVHEAMHVWFADRLSNYRIEEPFCKLTSFVISGALAAAHPDPCAWFSASMNYPDRLMYDLCDLGMDGDKLGAILRQTAAGSQRAGRTLSADEFATIVSEALDQDALPAFRDAGLLP